DPELNHFSGIVPCGITDGTVTSMTNEIGYSVEMSAVKAALAVEFRKVFANTTSDNDRKKTRLAAGETTDQQGI
ncbi:MAG TPA: hypothetical protein VJ952_02310, partial [Opitutales bacterium]|nr:hypothetical protein [Opitutales bacterium]